MPTALGIPRRSPIQVLAEPDVAWLRWSDENRYFQRGMAVGNRNLFCSPYISCLLHSQLYNTTFNPPPVFLSPLSTSSAQVTPRPPPALHQLAQLPSVSDLSTIITQPSKSSSHTSTTSLWLHHRLLQHQHVAILPSFFPKLQ